MPFKKGHKLSPGRPEGAQNKITKTVKQVFTEVFQSLQTDKEKEYALEKWAQQNPDAFYKLAARLIPTQITGADGKDLVLNIILKDEREKEEFEQTLKIG